MFLKDAGLIAGDAAAPLPVFAAAHALLKEAIDHGFGQDDITATLQLYLEETR
jgi:3-hydroxyisobutyrate dehydrogenase-like beta-hydroxyacid dehydrogenase